MVQVKSSPAPASASKAIANTAKKKTDTKKTTKPAEELESKKAVSSEKEQTEKLFQPTTSKPETAKDSSTAKSPASAGGAAPATTATKTADSSKSKSSGDSAQAQEAPKEKEGEKEKEAGNEKKAKKASAGGAPGGGGGGGGTSEGGEDTGAARAAAMVEKINKKLPNVKKDLDKASVNVCGEADKKSETLAKNEKDHDDATTKQTQTEKAVVPPADEGKAKSQEGQVDKLDEKKPPKPSKDGAKSELDKQIDQSVPKTMGDLSDFKKKDTAKSIGRQVTGEVTKEVKVVDETYNEIEKAPEPVPSTKEIKALPEIEVAPQTPELDLGKGAVPGLDKAHSDFKAFEEGSDEALQKEGISDKELEMVDSGDLLQARNERKGIKKSVKEEPSKIKQYASGQQDGVKKDMKQEEKQVRGHMEGKRKEKLNETKQKQKGTKSAIEKKREGVTKHIKGIYDRAQKKIKGKLDNLEKESMKRFDREQAKFSGEFEDEVNKDINAWKKERYSGAFGWFRKGKDWLLGIDDFPEVKAAFKRAKDNYVKKIDGLIVQITKDNQKVIDDCKKELQSARKEIKKYVAGLGPELKKTGEAAMKDMQKKLDELDTFIDKKKEELAKKLCDKKEEAIKKIDKKIEEMKVAMSGALSKLVGFLVEAMLKFFKWVLGKFGMDQGALMKVIDKGMRTIKQIVLHPIDFIMNLVRGVGQGIKNFGTNIKKHLITGVIEWLTGSLGGAGIQLPEKWDVKGVIHLILQVLGLTWERIRAKLVKQIGEEKVAMAEKSIDIIKRLVTEGPMALWDMIKEKAAEIKQTVMDGIRNWVITNIVKQGIIMFASFLSPAGAIVQAIKTIYNVIMFLIDNWDRIVNFVKTVFGAITDIAFGKIAAVAGAVERGMAMIIPMILDFMAKLLNLGGITKAVKNVIKKIRKPIDKIVNKMIKFVVKKAKKLFGAGKKAVKKGVKKGKEAIKKLIEWWTIKKSFKNKSGETHTLYFNGKGKSAKLMMRSNPKPIEAYVAELEKLASNKDKGTIAEIKAEIKKIDGYQASPNSKTDKVREQIHIAFKKIVKLSAKISIASDRGSKSKPYAIIWPKRSWNAYPELYFGPTFKSGTIIKQERLKKIVGKSKEDANKEDPKLVAKVEDWKKVAVYKPSGSGKLSDGTNLGITKGDYQMQSGKDFKLPKDIKSTPGGGKLTNPLKKYGYSFSKEYTDADHVKEIQVGGNDELANLWPLNASENRSSGSSLSRMKFGTGEKMTQLKKKAATKDVWIKVKSTKPG